MVEEILLKLPVKSLLRFSSVSKAWKSIISESRFVKRYGSHADREKLFVTSQIKTVSVSSKSKSKFEFVCPFSQNFPPVIASCDELWLAYVDSSLFLWNPSMGTYKRLPNPSNPTKLRNFYIFGLGYDSATDDYKILKFPHLDNHAKLFGAAELYSLRSDSWRDIPNFSANYSNFSNERPYVSFVSGKLHWWSLSKLISFDLSTEKLGEESPLNYFPTTGYICVLKGMLCVCKHAYHDFYCEADARTDIWVMEEYGVATSWTKMFTFKPFDSCSGKRFGTIVPLYIYGDGELLIRATKHKYLKEHEIFVYKDGKTTPREVIIYRSYNHGFMYADSLVAPAIWSTTTTTPSDSVHKFSR